jgi:hypothetical protein
VAADLEHAWRPRVGRHEIVDDDRRPSVELNVSVLLGGRDVVTPDVDRAEIRVVPERCRHHMRFAIAACWGDPSKPLACELLDLGSGQLGHAPIRQGELLIKSSAVCELRRVVDIVTKPARCRRCAGGERQVPAGAMSFAPPHFPRSMAEVE